VKFPTYSGTARRGFRYFALQFVQRLEVRALPNAKRRS
jgi:hypothetical protein